MSEENELPAVPVDFISGKEPFYFDIERCKRLTSSGWRSNEAVDLISLQVLRFSYDLITQHHQETWRALKKDISEANDRDLMNENSLAVTKSVTDILLRDVLFGIEKGAIAVLRSGLLSLLISLAREDLTCLESRDLWIAKDFIDTGLQKRMVSILSKAEPDVWRREVEWNGIPAGLRECYFDDFNKMFNVTMRIPEVKDAEGVITGWILIAFLRSQRGIADQVNDN